MNPDEQEPLNPLAQYRFQNNITWSLIATRTGISLPQIQRIANYPLSKLAHIRITTALAIKEATGVDLVDFVAKQMHH